MKKNSKFKKIISYLVLGSFFSSLGIPAATAANSSSNEEQIVYQSAKTIPADFYQSASQVTTSSNITQIADQVPSTYGATTFGNVDQIINQARDIMRIKAVNEVYNTPKWNGIALRGTTLPDEDFKYELKNTNVEPIGSPSISYEDTVYIGHSILHNNSNVDQTLTTQSFSETVTDSVTTSTTQAVGTSVTASSNFQVPFVGQAGVSISTSYDFSKTNTNTNTKSVTHTVEPQKILVPANSSVDVTVYLTKAKIRGNVALKGQLTGSESGEVLVQAKNLTMGWVYAAYKNYSFTLAELANKYGGNKGSMEQGTYFFGIIPNSDGSINIAGRGTYEANVGAELVVSVKDLNSGKTGEIKLDGSPIGDKGQTGVYPSDVEYISEGEIKVPNLDYNNPADTKVQLFKDSNYQGKRVILDEGRYTYSQFSEIGNNTLSSIKVPGDYTVTLFENADFTGRKVKLNGDSSWLGDFNDMTSSIIIAKGKVNFYENANQIGVAYPRLTLGEGKYKFSEFELEPGRVRTLVIPKMYTVIFYENEDFTGISRTYTKDVLQLDAFGMGAKSFEITTELVK